MPFKHQSNCYRTFNGQRWKNFGDLLDPQFEASAAAAKAAGVRVRLRKHPDGYRQAFCHPDDEMKLAAFFG